MPRISWFHDAEPEEKGSFCDTDSKNHYDNVDGFEAMKQAQEAESRGDEAEWVDKSIFGLNDPTREEMDAIRPDDRYNVYSSERDGQGVSGQSKQEPGR